MIGAKRWDTREGASMWVPSYYPGSCVSQSSALLLITAVFTSSGIIFIIFTSLLTQGHVLSFTDQGPGECDVWHVIMWWHLSCSVSATHHWWPVWWCLSPGTDLWPVSHDISMTEKEHQQSSPVATMPWLRRSWNCSHGVRCHGLSVSLMTAYYCIISPHELTMADHSWRGYWPREEYLSNDKWLCIGHPVCIRHGYWHGNERGH